MPDKQTPRWFVDTTCSAELAELPDPRIRRPCCLSSPSPSIRPNRNFYEVDSIGLYIMMPGLKRRAGHSLNRMTQNAEVVSPHQPALGRVRLVATPPASPRTECISDQEALRRLPQSLGSLQSKFEVSHTGTSSKASVLQVTATVNQHIFFHTHVLISASMQAPPNLTMHGSKLCFQSD